MKIKQLLHDYVLIKPDIEEDLCINGLYIPQSCQEGASTGEVILVGKDVENVQPGEFVVFPFNVKNSRTNFMEYKEEGVLYYLIHEFDISAVLTEN